MYMYLKLLQSCKGGIEVFRRRSSVQLRQGNSWVVRRILRGDLSRQNHKQTSRLRRQWENSNSIFFLRPQEIVLIQIFTDWVGLWRINASCTSTSYDSTRFVDVPSSVHVKTEVKLKQQICLEDLKIGNQIGLVKVFFLEKLSCVQVQVHVNVYNYVVYM